MKKSLRDENIQVLVKLSEILDKSLKNTYISTGKIDKEIVKMLYSVENAIASKEL